MNFTILSFILYLIYFSQAQVQTGTEVPCFNGICNDAYCGYSGTIADNWVIGYQGQCKIVNCEILLQHVSNNSCRSCYQNDPPPSRIYPNLYSNACSRSDCQAISAAKIWTSTSCTDCFGPRFRAYDDKSACFNLDEQTLKGSTKVLCVSSDCNLVSCGYAGNAFNNWEEAGDGFCVISNCENLINLDTPIRLNEISCKSCFSIENPPRKYPNLQQNGCVRSNCWKLLYDNYGWTSTSCIDCYGIRFRAFENKTSCFDLDQYSYLSILTLNMVIQLILLLMIL